MKRIVVSLVVIGLLGMSVLSVAAQDTTEVVYGNTSAGENQPGWLFNRDTSTSTPFEFSSAEASIGQGSLYVLPIGPNPSDKFIGEYFINEPIANIESIAFDFLIGSGGESSDAVQFYMNAYANFGESDDLKFYDCRYAIFVNVSAVEGFTTVTFDPDQSYLVTTRTGGEASPYTCPASPAQMDTLSPGSNVRVFSLNVGDSTASDVGIDGYLDNVVVSLAGGTTTFDFELPTSAELIDDLRTDTAELITNRKAERTLMASLSRAERFMEIRPQFAQIALLQYMLQVQLYEFVGLIDGDAADQLIAQAQAISSSMN